MNQYKVIGGSHFFEIGSTVKLIEVDGDEGALFECIDSGLQQFVKMADVELIEVSQQEATEKLAAVVADIYLKITEAENFADKHGLSFSLDIAYDMVGDYFGKGTDEMQELHGCDEGWNT